MSTARAKRSASAKARALAHAGAPIRPRKASVTSKNPKLAALIRRHFTKKGRAERIARAEQALREIDQLAATFKVDDETLKWIVEDPDLEYL